MKRKHLIAAAAGLVVVVIAGALLANPQAGQPSGTPTPEPEPPEQITAKGVIVPVRQAKLAFRTSGQVAALPKVGDRVEEGQEIARLAAAELDLAVTQAEDNVAVNAALLAQSQAPARDVDLAVAQAAYDQALARHNQILSGAPPADLQAARSAVASAEAALLAAQTQLKQLQDGPTPAALAEAESAVSNAQAALAAAEQRQAALDPHGAARANEIRNAELGLESARNALWSAQIDRDATKGLYGADSPQGKAADARVAAAETAVAQAKAALEAKQAPPEAGEVKAAAEAVASAQANLRTAQSRLDQLKAGPTQAELDAAKSAVRSAEAALSGAKAKLELAQSGGTSFDKEASAAAVAQAKAALDLRKAGVSPADLAVLEARLKQARTALEQAKAARQAALIVAPLSGTVVWVGANVGDTLTPGVPVVVVADLSQLQVETTDLDEEAVTKLTVGEGVKVTVNAFAEKVLDGKIQAIAPLATTTASGDANYTVTIALGEPDPALRLGMTTRVEFAATY